LKAKLTSPEQLRQHAWSRLNELRFVLMTTRDASGRLEASAHIPWLPRERRQLMNTSTLRNGALALMAGLAFTGCGTWTDAQKGTAIGAGAGAAVGHAVGGGVLGTVGGAAVGGVIGHEIGENRDEKKQGGK
jgi:osmotically inducible lipoprotein OsmB